MTALCPVCATESVDEEIDEAGSARDALFYHLDSDGLFHRHDPRERKTRHQCPSGHQWTEAGRQTCPAPGCDFGKDDHEVVAVP